MGALEPIEGEGVVPVPPAGATAGASGGGLRALLEVVDRDDHVRQAWPIAAWPIRVGRALDNEIVLTDPHVAPHHFRIEEGADGLALGIGPTVNGMTLGAQRLEAGALVPLPHDRETVELQAGRTRLRLRLADAALAPEVPLVANAVRHLRLAPTLALVAALLVGLGFYAFLQTDADSAVRVIGNTLVTGFAAGAIWCGGWALLSKTITRQSHFGWHLRVFSVGALALLALTGLPGLIAFALSWPWVTDFTFIATYAIGAATLYFHLLALEPARPRLMRTVLTGGVVVGIALTLWFNLQRNGRVGDELYMSHLYPPALRLARPQPVDRFVDGLKSLQPLLDRKARETGISGGGSSHDESDEDE